MQQFFKSELGRSMLEMLGVLAIVGVLSIASIAGYSYAVTKWKALDTLDEVATRAIEYDRQLAMRRDWVPGDVFNNYDLGNETSLGYGISGFVSEEDNYFEIEVTGVPIEVCRQLARELEGVIYGPIVSMTVGEADFGTEIECVENARVAFLIGEDWETYASNNEATTSLTETDIEATPVTLTMTPVPSTTPVTMTQSPMITMSGFCSSNDNCEDDEYCWLDSSTNDYSSCDKPVLGYCKKADVSQTATINGSVYKRSADFMNWWSVQNFCDRVGGSMISLSELGCSAVRESGCSSDNVQDMKSILDKTVWVSEWERHNTYSTCSGYSIGYSSSSGYGYIGQYAMSAPSASPQALCRVGGSGGVEQTIPPFVSTLPPCEANEIYYEGECVASCAKNEDCTGENEYCWLDSSTNNYSCTEKPTKGVCKTAAVSHTKKINGFTYKKSNDRMNWWSAENFCARIGGERVNVSDFQCGAVMEDAYCNADNTGSPSGTRSDTMKEFMSGLGSDYVWTGDDAHGLCGALLVNLYSGYVRGYDHDYSTYALCRLGG